MITLELKHSLEIYKQKRYSKIDNIPTDKMLKVDSNEVTKVTKKNQSYLICTCEASGKTGHRSFCRHQKFFVLFPLLELFTNQLDKLIPVYENWVKCDLPINPELCLNDLRNLKRILCQEKN